LILRKKGKKKKGKKKNKKKKQKVIQGKGEVEEAQ